MMEKTENRYVYLDNIRNMLVYTVVFFHVICMYAYPLVFWWPVVDAKGSSRVYEALIMIMDLYQMPVLLFIAALFIFPSLNARSAPGYIKKRFSRLFVPVIVFLFCAADVAYQILLTRVNGSSPDYFRTFLAFWSDFMHFSAITFIAKGKMLNQVSFNMQYTWFLSLLFFTTLLTVLLSLPFRKKEKKQREPDTRKKIILKTIVFAVMAGFFYCALAIWYPLHGIDFNAWVRVFGLVQVRISQFWMLLALFMFGLYMHERDWLASGDIGSWKTWGALSFVVLFILVLAFKPYLPMIEEFVKVSEHNMIFADKIPFPGITKPFAQLYTSINFMLLPACIFFLMFFLSFAKKFFNRPNKVTTFCSKHSINVYILHFVPVILLQYSFMNIPLPSIVKIIAIMIIVIPACLWLSYRMVIPHPAAAIVLFAVLKLASLYAGFEFYYNALLAILFLSFAGAALEAGKLVRDRGQVCP